MGIQPPELDPRGLGFTSILTQIFGLPTTLDPATQNDLEVRNSLLRVEARTELQNERLIELSSKLRRLGFVLEDREPEYELFLRALNELKHDRRGAVSPEHLAKRNQVAKLLLSKIVAEKEPRA